MTTNAGASVFSLPAVFVPIEYIFFFSVQSYFFFRTPVESIGIIRVPRIGGVQGIN